jgi:hypothetical protein
MKHLLLLLFAIGLHAQNSSVKAFFEGLTLGSKAPASQEVLAAVDQIQSLSKQDAQDLLPTLFNALKATDSEAVGMPICQALYALSRRPDSGDLLRPHLAEIFAVYGRGDRRYKTTVNMVFANLKPPATEAVPLLAGFLTAKVGTAAEKVDALAVLLDIQHDNPQSEEVRLVVLNLSMDSHTRRAALFAAARPGATKKVTDRIAQDLDDSSEDVQIGAIQGLALLGNGTVNQYRKELTKTTQYGATPTVKRLAQDVLDAKDLRCTTLQGQPIKPCN